MNKDGEEVWVNEFDDEEIEKRCTLGGNLIMKKLPVATLILNNILKNIEIPNKIEIVDVSFWVVILPK